MKKAILSVSAAAAMIGGLFYFGWYRSRHGANSANRPVWREVKRYADDSDNGALHPFHTG